MKKKIRVGVLFGGRSAEHEISLLSAKNIVNALDKEKYELVLIGINKNGEWLLQDSARYLVDAHDAKLVHLSKSLENVALVPKENRSQLVSLSHKKNLASLDVIFPVLHGTYGEDGTIQGLLKLADIPFVGASVLGSAVGMDKDVMKRLLRDANIPIAKFITLTKASLLQTSFALLQKELGLPFFVKPANLGSSIGVSKVKNEKEWMRASEEAFLFDRKILVEEFIEGREIECSVLGNEEPIASLPGEVIPSDEFNSYKAKYLDEAGTIFEIPAKLDRETIKAVQNLSIKAYSILCCEGMARVDCFLKKDGRIYINEINTIPGFTNMSPYPKLWQASGLSYPDLLDKLIQLALERYENEKKLKTTYEDISPIVK